MPAPGPELWREVMRALWMLRADEKPVTAEQVALHLVIASPKRGKGWQALFADQVLEALNGLKRHGMVRSVRRHHKGVGPLWRP